MDGPTRPGVQPGQPAQMDRTTVVFKSTTSNLLETFFFLSGVDNVFSHYKIKK